LGGVIHATSSCSFSPAGTISAKSWTVTQSGNVITVASSGGCTFTGPIQPMGGKFLFQSTFSCSGGFSGTASHEVTVVDNAMIFKGTENFTAGTGTPCQRTSVGGGINTVGGGTLITSIPYTVTAHEVSGNCTLGPDQNVSGTLTLTGQANTYTTLLPVNAAATLTVPGSNTLVYSFPDGNGTTTENMQLTFDSTSRLITGSTNWTHTNGCMGYMTFSGSW